MRPPSLYLIPGESVVGNEERVDDVHDAVDGLDIRRGLLGLAVESMPG